MLRVWLYNYYLIKVLSTYYNFGKNLTLLHNDYFKANKSINLLQKLKSIPLSNPMLNNCVWLEICSQLEESFCLVPLNLIQALIKFLSYIYDKQSRNLIHTCIHVLYMYTYMHEGNIVIDSPSILDAINFIERRQDTYWRKEG